MSEEYIKLTDNEKKELLNIARKTLEYKFSKKDLNEISTSEKRLYELKHGCFVTLKKSGHLRGCIGTFVSKNNLVENVKNMALASAFEDPRFSKVTVDELKEITIEISVLYPLIKIKDINEIEVGRDGLYIVYGYYHGVLLPQVAVEYGWDREEFLSHTCIKAGLPKDAWRKLNLDIYRFEGEIFSEEEYIRL